MFCLVAEGEEREGDGLLGGRGGGHHQVLHAAGCDTRHSAAPADWLAGKAAAAAAAREEATLSLPRTALRCTVTQPGL